MKQIAILGGGAFGTAMATVCARNGHNVRLWCFEKEVIDAIKNSGINQRYLPDIALPKSISASTDMAEVVQNAEIIIEAVPVPHLRNVILQAKSYVPENMPWVTLSKGIENETLMLPSQIVDDVFDRDVKKAVISGPSFAIELAQEQITGVAVAATDAELQKMVCDTLRNSFLRPYLSDDMIGLQIGGALKNALALGMGLLEGAGYCKNAQALFFDRGLQEMMLCARMMGGKKETLIGLAGVGDLFLTATCTKSRNYQFGMLRGQGAKREAIIEKLGTVPEGLNTLVALEKIITKFDLNIPFLQGVYGMINHDTSPECFFAKIMQMQLKNDVL